MANARPCWCAALALIGGLLGSSAGATQEGELAASSQSLLLDDSRFVREAALDRLQQIRFAFREPKAEADEQPVWLRGYGHRGSLDGEGPAGRVEEQGGGAFVGLDRAFGDTWVAGVLAGYSQLDVDLDGAAADVDIDSYHLGAYAAMRYYNQLGLKLGAAFSDDRLDSRSGDDDGRRWQAFAEGVYAMDFETATLEAFANLAYVALHSDGLDGAAWVVDSEERQVTFSTLGWRYATRFDLSAEQRLIARASLGWRHAFGDTEARTDGVLLADGSRFHSRGVALSEDSLRLDLGADYGVTPTSYIGLFYLGQYADAARDNGLSARLSLRF
ncbi:autotransporter domain-containing protein [Pseudomonas sp. UL073]|uniref:Autotransporter domain-containing protein n=1 Tax=Zestomonas insulae TaxID=2809017 RepID=A0ABS2IA70_9GAMM|nr:autotransporter domain-containing protein [Pseudomonas insulae]MBM7059905.1 autotransporter domain-containing protein [Pseudomonas insulae]